MRRKHLDRGRGRFCAGGVVIHKQQTARAGRQAGPTNRSVMPRMLCNPATIRTENRVKSCSRNCAGRARSWTGSRRCWPGSSYRPKGAGRIFGGHPGAVLQAGPGPAGDPGRSEHGGDPAAARRAGAGTPLPGGAPAAAPCLPGELAERPGRHHRPGETHQGDSTGKDAGLVSARAASAARRQHYSAACFSPMAAARASRAANASSRGTPLHMTVPRTSTFRLGISPAICSAAWVPQP